MTVFEILGLEVAWLSALWLCVPASRPWPSNEVEPSAWQGRWEQVLLACYTFYHLPALFVLGLIVPGLCRDWKHVRPTGFLAAAAITAACLSVSAMKA